ncbi:B12-binding domain-containing radical SAM protein [Butyrivibrio sp. NC3005]|uniref:B12-binding domain-containing radical SAM protein n=1 Tax=Butyrivibrio sp. NC3005 TaxID=1280685 RepID=UPI0003F5A938|nr:B12-binding domain-containing radical SAM protein [Butyrivibrio sp. NC3005]
MKISIAYPPLENVKGTPLLGQNRQFQWFNSPTYIYPMVPAYCATLLKSKGFEVRWDDGIAEEKTYKQFVEEVLSDDIDVMMIETKAPVVKLHWEIVKEFKKLKPSMIIVMVGDHVTAFPEETMNECPVDYILTGGNYDFLMDNLCENLRDNNGILDAEKLDYGIWYREKAEDGTVVVKNTGAFRLNQDLNSLPMIDRDLTKWKLYSEKNGNYSKIPGTYTMAARDCWHHECTFCSWTTLYPQYSMRSPEKLLDEIGVLIEKYGVKEIMDDSGAFPIGEWLHTFCKGMIERGYNKKVIMDCNMRLCALSLEEYKLMKEAGFRFVLFGLESANQSTLDRIVKKEKIENMVESLQNAKKAGLSPHITLMFGYPWEDEAQVQNTVKLGRKILIKGWAHTLQATVLIPYPGTPLYRECKENGWLLTEDYAEFDQRMPVMKTPMGSEKILEAVQSVYKVAFNPEFLWRRLTGIRSFSDVKFYARAAKQVMGHLLDFSKK